MFNFILSLIDKIYYECYSTYCQFFLITAIILVNNSKLVFEN